MEAAAVGESPLWSNFNSSVSFFLSVRVSRVPLWLGVGSMDERVLLLVWVSWLHCDGSAGLTRGSVGSLLGSLLTLTGLSTTPFEGTVDGDSAFFAVDGECSGGEE